MARAKTQKNGRLEEALENLLQSQATLARVQTSLMERVSETDSEIAKFRRIATERFERIEAILLAHTNTLAEHGRLLAELTQIVRALPDAVRERMGFRVPEQRSPEE